MIPLIPAKLPHLWLFALLFCKLPPFSLVQKRIFRYY